MKRLMIASLLVMTAGGTWRVTTTLERKHLQRLERWAGDAEMRAARAHRRTEGYKRTIGGANPPSAGEAVARPDVAMSPPDDLGLVLKGGSR